MSDLISREQAIDSWNKLSKRGRTEFDQVLMTLPSTDRPTGEWIAYKGMQPPKFQGKHYCSNCYHAIHLASNDNVYNYCPNCGVHRKEQTMAKWLEKEVLSLLDGAPLIEDWQSARCSACGKYHTTPYMYYFDEYKFCPNCGARMKGADKE